MARVDWPVRYRMGSGRFARAYLVEVDGFLHESPITWYAAKNSWGIAPGYDRPAHSSFERQINLSCLNCHVGRAELVGGSGHRARLHEHAIGCERCHGPGSLHVEERRAQQQVPGADDWTIVNPGKLPRSRLEAICASCHLIGAAAIPLRGRDAGDFRPGMSSTDFRIVYQFDSGGDKMKVVGHIEQLRASACYQ